MISKLLSRAALFVAAAVLPATQASAATLTVLNSFKSTGKGGDYPYGGLIADSAGNLYGTTQDGGASNDGTVFKLTPPATGKKWTETVLNSFNRTNGKQPLGSLLADSAGNLYGTTDYGGASNFGTVFELTPPAAGQTAWTEAVLISFNGTNGKTPNSGSLIADNAGNLYGTTGMGGASNAGTVFELTPPAAGQTAWTETVLLSFTKKHGEHPFAGVIADSAGNLYGSTAGGGAVNYGTVFRLAPPAAGQTAWKQTILFSFNGTDGGNPAGGLIFDSAGNLYGETAGGGASSYGTVFELTPPAAGQTAWTETVLASFNETDGGFPTGSLIFDRAGNLYGTTQQGGVSNDGTVFELMPPAAGQTAWTQNVLISFDGTNGVLPSSGVIADAAGNLYGTTSQGGSTYQGENAGYGTVFKLTP
jgi:uncharacterized repeat protein (TIGR03803 family)